jgi:hypothetical protein
VREATSRRLSGPRRSIGAREAIATFSIRSISSLNLWLRVAIPDFKNVRLSFFSLWKRAAIRS